MEVLDLSGMTAGQDCTNNVKRFGLHYYTIRTVPGTIPECIFSLTNITSIYLAGNGISSKLYDLPILSKLRNISISNNRLFGTIPVTIQQKWSLEYLDFSFNYLGGTVTKMENATGIIYLQSNRISG